MFLKRFGTSPQGGSGRSFGVAGSSTFERGAFTSLHQKCTTEIHRRADTRICSRLNTRNLSQGSGFTCVQAEKCPHCYLIWFISTRSYLISSSTSGVTSVTIQAWVNDKELPLVHWNAVCLYILSQKVVQKFRIRS